MHGFSWGKVVGTHEICSLLITINKENIQTKEGNLESDNEDEVAR